MVGVGVGVSVGLGVTRAGVGEGDGDAVAEGLAVGVAGSAATMIVVSDAALDDDSSVAPVGAGWP